MGINDIRVEVESGETEVLYFFAHWELGRFGWAFPVIPDAVFSVRLGREATFMVEYDRGTEDRSELSGKLRQYQSVAGSFPFDAVLIVTESSAAIDKLTTRVFKGTITPAVGQPYTVEAVFKAPNRAMQVSNYQNGKQTVVFDGTNGWSAFGPRVQPIEGAVDYLESEVARICRF